MQIHQIQPRHKQRKARRVGRGGKRGTYSGRGIKGQSSRAGRRMQPRVRELFKRYPKLRGYRRAASTKPLVVNLTQLEKYFEKGATINPVTLAQKKIAGTMKGKARGIKILGMGELSKALTVENCAVSKSAKAKIEKAGGVIK